MTLEEKAESKRTITVELEADDFRRINVMKASSNLSWPNFFKRLAFEKLACVVCKNPLDISIVNGNTELYCPNCKKIFYLIAEK